VHLAVSNHHLFAVKPDLLVAHLPRPSLRLFLSTKTAEALLLASMLSLRRQQ
jgi:hypothetical protein